MEGPGPEVNYSVTASNFGGQIRDPGGSTIKCCAFILVLTCLCLITTNKPNLERENINTF